MSNTKKVTVAKSDELEALSEMKTMSEKIRYLSNVGYDKGDISRILDIRYQWVRNVLITPLKKK
jgi:hypothetical protein